MTESIEEVAQIDMVEDIAALARKLADKEPFKSASGAESLRAFATHLEDMVTSTGQTPAVTVAFRSRRKKSA